MSLIAIHSHKYDLDGPIYLTSEPNGFSRLYHKKDKVAYGPAFESPSPKSNLGEWVSKHFSVHPDTYYGLMKLAQPESKKLKIEGEEEKDKYTRFPEFELPQSLIESHFLTYLSKEEIIKALIDDRELLEKYKDVLLKLISLDFSFFFAGNRNELNGVKIGADEAINVNITKLDKDAIEEWPDEDDLISPFIEMETLTIDETIDWNRVAYDTLLTTDRDWKLKTLKLVSSGGPFKPVPAWHIPIEKVSLEGPIESTLSFPKDVTHARTIKSAAHISSGPSGAERGFVYFPKTLKYLSCENEPDGQIITGFKYLETLRTSSRLHPSSMLDSESGMSFLKILECDLYSLSRWYSKLTASLQSLTLKRFDFDDPYSPLQKILIRAPNLSFLDIKGITGIEERTISLLAFPESKNLVEIHLEDGSHVPDLPYPNPVKRLHLASITKFGGGARAFRYHNNIEKYVEAEVPFMSWKNAPDLEELEISNALPGQFADSLAEFIIRKHPRLVKFVAGGVTYLPRHEQYIVRKSQETNRNEIVIVSPSTLPQKPAKEVPQKQKTVRVEDFPLKIILEYLAKHSRDSKCDPGREMDLALEEARHSAQKSNQKEKKIEFQTLVSNANPLCFIPTKHLEYLALKRKLALRNMPRSLISFGDDMANDSPIDVKKYLGTAGLPEYLFMPKEELREALSRNRRADISMPQSYASFIDELKDMDISKFENFDGITKELIKNIRDECNEIIDTLNVKSDTLILVTGSDLHWHAHVMRNAMGMKVVYVPTIYAHYSHPKKQEGITSKNVTAFREKGLKGFIDHACRFTEDRLRQYVDTPVYFPSHKTTFIVISSDNLDNTECRKSIQFHLSRIYRVDDTKIQHVILKPISNLNTLVRTVETRSSILKINNIQIGTEHASYLNVLRKRDGPFGFPGMKKFFPSMWKEIWKMELEYPPLSYDETIVHYFNFKYEKIFDFKFPVLDIPAYDPSALVHLFDIY